MGNCHEIGQQDHEFLWLPSFCLAALPPICLCPTQPHVLSCPGWPSSPPGPDMTDSRHQFSAPFSLWKAVDYRVNPNGPSSNFLSTSNEKKGYRVGFTDNVGDKLSWKTLTEDTKHLIFRTTVRSANTTTPNLCHELPSGRAILLTPVLPPMKIYQTSLNSISCGVSKSVKATHHSTLIPHLRQLSLWMI